MKDRRIIDHSKKRWRHVGFTVNLCESKLYLTLVMRSLTCQHAVLVANTLLSLILMLKYQSYDCF